MGNVGDAVALSVGVARRVALCNALRELVVVSHGLLLADRERLTADTVLPNTLLRVDESEFVMLAVRDRDADREGVFRGVDVSGMRVLVVLDGVLDAVGELLSLPLDVRDAVGDTLLDALALAVDVSVVLCVRDGDAVVDAEALDVPTVRMPVGDRVSDVHALTLEV